MRLVANGPGIGDAMVLSLLAHELQKIGTRPQISTCFPELFYYNPDVDGSFGWDGPGHRSFPEYDNPKILGARSIYKDMLMKVGVDPSNVEIRQRFYFGEKDEEFEEHLPKMKHFVTIQPFAGSWTKNKNWITQNWHEVSNSIANLGIPVFQLGAQGEHEISGANQSFVGAPLRAVAMLLARSSLHLCVVSGTMHIASAVGAPTVVVFGGREDPRVTGYPGHENLFHEPSQGCFSCWKVEPCPHGFPQPCMSFICIGDVMDCAMQILTRKIS